MNRKLLAGAVVALAAFVAVGIGGMASADDGDRRTPETGKTAGITDPQPDSGMIYAF